MSEQQIKEPVAPYTTAAIQIEEKATERAQEVVRVQFPPYFERFLEERDRRFSSDLARLKVEIQHVREELGLLRADTERHFVEIREEMGRRFAEAKEERERGFAEAKAERERGFAEAKEERERGFAEAKEERGHGFAEAKEERERGFAEAKAERKALREDMETMRLRLEKRMDAHLRWNLGLLFPIVLGVLAIVFKVFFAMP